MKKRFLFLLIPLLFITKVNASSLEGLAFMNRTANSFPFTTDFNEPYRYNSQYFLFKNDGNLPTYAILTACGTGPLSFQMIQGQGTVIYMGYAELGGSCSAGQYTGTQYSYYFNLASYTDAGNGNSGINYSMYVSSDVPYNVWSTFRSLSYSSSSDFSTAVQNQTIIQNQRTFTDNQEDLKKSQEETKKAIDDLDKNVTNSNVYGAEDTAGNFFSDFDVTDNGGISSIVTAPLVAIQAMLNNQCSPLTATYKGKQVSLPCGSSFWSNLGGIKTFLNIAIGGLLCYRIIVKLFKLIEDFKDPENDKVEVMNL